MEPGSTGQGTDSPADLWAPPSPSFLWPFCPQGWADGERQLHPSWESLVSYFTPWDLGFRICKRSWNLSSRRARVRIKYLLNIKVDGARQSGTSKALLSCFSREQAEESKYLKPKGTEKTPSALVPFASTQVPKVVLTRPVVSPGSHAPCPVLGTSRRVDRGRRVQR